MTLIISPVLDIYGCIENYPDLVLKKNNSSLLQLFLVVPRVDWQFLLEVFSCNPRVARARVGGHLLESPLVDLAAGLKG